MNLFFCSTCNNPLKINKGDYIFTYNIECCNNHSSKNVDLENILSSNKGKNYICENHRKKNIIHCFDCNADICFLCYKKIHNLHKMEYLKVLNYEHIIVSSIKNELERDKKYIESFIGELIHFRNQFNFLIDKLKSDLQKFHKFRFNLIDNISPENSPYINIENVKNLIEDKNFLKIKNIMKDFLSCDVFIQKYVCLGDIFELMFEKGKYIENQNIKNILKEKIIPIDEKYFMKIDKHKLIILEKSLLELNLKKYKLDNIFERSMYFNIDKIELKANENIKKRLSLYLLVYPQGFQHFNQKTKLYEITIENLCDFNIKEVAEFDKSINLFVLSENKYIIDDYKNIFLYDESFKSPELISNEISGIIEFLKIDSNTFIYSSRKSYFEIEIFLANIIDNNININKINNCGDSLIYFSEKNKIIFTNDKEFIYLSNFNSIKPEVIQKFEVKDLYNHKFLINTKLVRNLTSFNDESIYITIQKCDKIFLVQYKIIESELEEISRIQI